MKLSSSLVFASPFGFQTWHFQLLLIFLPLLLHSFFFFCSCCSWCCHCCNCCFNCCCDCYFDCCYHCCCNCYFDSSCCDCCCDFRLGYCCCTSVVILVVIVVVIVVGLFLLMPFLFLFNALFLWTLSENLGLLLSRTGLWSVRDKNNPKFSRALYQYLWCPSYNVGRSLKRQPA